MNFPADIIDGCESAALIYSGGDEFRGSGIDDAVLVEWPVAIQPIAAAVYNSAWTVAPTVAGWLASADRTWDVVAAFAGGFEQVADWAGVATKYVVALLADLNADGLEHAVPMGWTVSRVVPNGDGSSWLVLESAPPG